MAVKSGGTGQFMIPASPAVGTTCSSGTANTYTTAYIQMTASAGAVYVIGATMQVVAASNPTYAHLQIATGSAGAEAIVGQVPFGYYSISATSTNCCSYVAIDPPIAIANSIRIAVKTADSVGGLGHKVTLACILQANVVDAGIAETLPAIPANWITAAGISGNAIASQPTGIASSVTAAVTLPSIPANWITAAGVSANAIATQPTGIASSVTAAVTLPSIPANWITDAGISANAFAGETISSVTAAVTLPSIPGNWITAAGISANAFAAQPVSSVTAAVTATLGSIPANWITAAGISSGAMAGKGDWNVGKTGYSLTQAFPANFSALGIGAGGNITTVDTLTTYTGNTPQTGDAYARIGAAGAGLTALGDTRIANLDATVTSRMATFVYTAPDNTDIAAIKVQTDKLAFTIANQVDTNIRSVNSTTVTGNGSPGTEWGP